MLVSVVIPTYNREKVLLDAIKSVLNQTYKDLEVIVIDDGSTDNTKEILDTIQDKRFRYVFQENAGACVARNHGILLARGEYIAFQDSDDEWYPNKLEHQIKALKTNNADIVFCGFEKVYPDSTRKKIPGYIEQKFYTQRELIYESIVSTQTILGKAEAIRSIGFDDSMPRMQDYDFVIRASEKYMIYYLNEVLVNVYEQPDSITATKKQYGKKLEVTQKILTKYSYLKSKYPEWDLKMLKTIAHSQIMIGENANDTLLEIYRKQKNAINLGKYLLNKVGLLKFILI